MASAYFIEARQSPLCLFSSISFFLSQEPALQPLGRPSMNLSIMEKSLLLQLTWVLSLFLLRAKAKVLTSLEDAGFCRSYKFAGEKN